MHPKVNLYDVFALNAAEPVRVTLFVAASYELYVNVAITVAPDDICNCTVLAIEAG